ELLTTSRVHREFQSSLDGFSTAVGEVRPRRRLDRNDRIEFLSELRHVAVVIISAAHVNELFSLLLNRFDDFGMAMAGRTDRNAGVTVEKNIAVHVFHPNAAGTFSDEFKGWPRVGWVHKFCIRFNDLLAVWTRQRRFDF